MATSKRSFGPDYLKSIIHYDEGTGVFTWKKRNTHRKCWNRRYAGTQAGTIIENGYSMKYRMIRIDGKGYMAHALAHLYMTGNWPAHFIDHADREGLNNAWSNLRPASAQQNAANAKRYSKNTSGFKGVSWCRRNKRWRAMYGQHWLGQYKTKEEAHAAYMSKARELHGEFARSE